MGNSASSFRARAYVSAYFVLWATVRWEGTALLGALEDWRFK
jgi:hypothetical protein